jgi:anti-sigma B factor antagonist
VLERAQPGADEARTGARGQLTITRRPGEGGRQLLELAGELDLACADAVRSELEAIEADAPEATVVDLSALRFIDSTGLSVLFDAVERASAAGRRITFTRSSPAVERTLRLSGLDQVLSFD